MDSKLFTRICAESGRLEVEPLRDLIYLERYGVAFDSDRKDGNPRRAILFEEKELNVMDNCLFVFLTSDEVEKLKNAGYVMQAFNFNRWITL